jgi:hypothetical protein
MWRLVTSTFVSLTFISSVAAAQQPCTTDAARVVAEIYRHTLERGVDAGAQRWQQALANGQMNVREVVRSVAKSPEYQQRFWRTEAGEGQPYERSVARLYRHILGRQPDEGGVRTWAGVAQQQGIGAVVDGLINSAEYTNSFGDTGVPGSGGLRFCENGAAQSSSLGDRFRGMDRNGDGRISRSEWRGGDVAFNNQDRNNDGVLSDTEITSAGRAEGRRARDYDFDALDVNGNNRIERREWQARLDAFNRLDVNNNGVLTREELEGTAGVGTAGNIVTVGGDRQWVDTGIDVRAGDNVTLNADGQIRLSRNTRDVATAAGNNRRNPGSTIESAPAGSLLARFGNSNPLFVGGNRTIRAPRNGRLYLGVNDDYFEDNTGEYKVTVDVN